jgi:serine/threonine protein kinase
VHRDIKPANVIITNSGAVKVMDFGIARALHGAQSTMTQTGMVMGTPQYLSPEQALGKAVDHRSDLYATGCLLYELLALRPPFTGETPLSVVYQHVQDIPLPPSEVSDVVPPELDGLVMRSLAKDPDDRFQSAEEMRGMVQYGLQMLEQQGSHTGSWNTGPVDMHDGAITPAMGMTGPTVIGHPVHGETSQSPILPPMNPNDGGYDGGHRDGRGGKRGGRAKAWLFAVLAVLAIAGGIAFAVDKANHSTDNQKHGTTVTPTPSKSQDSPTPSDEQTEQSEEPDTSTGGNQEPSWEPSYSDSFTPTDPGTPTDDPTTADPTDPTDQPTDQPTEPTDEPSSPGSTTGSGGDPGGTPGGQAGAPGGSGG